jgi:hypothetical protein
LVQSGKNATYYFSVETVSVFLIPGILSVLARGVASGSFLSEPQIFLWYWAGVSAVFAWSSSVVLVVFGPISVCLTRSLFVQDEEEATKGLDHVYMREIVIGHFCSRK